MEENRKIRVAITQGDTNGIGYELIFKTFSEPEMLELCTPIVYGSPKVAAYHRKALDLQASFSIIGNASEAKEGRINLLTTYDDETKIDFGIATPESGQAALKALDRAMSDYRDGAFDVLITAPLNKSNIQGEGFNFISHTDYIETSLNESGQSLSILIHEGIRIAFMTNDIALKDVASTINKDNIEEKATLFINTLRRDFRISNPRIALLALNPNTNEDGTFGKEEQEIITPAINELADNNLQVFGPYAADDFFGNGYFNQFDGIIAMYHDQGMAPFKAIADNYGVIYTAGLSIIRAESDQTVDYEHAGKNESDESAFRHAIYLAIDNFQNRINYDEAAANPLKKLYREKRDESEKVRFAIPKKHSNAPFNPHRQDVADNSAHPTETQAEKPAE